MCDRRDLHEAANEAVAIGDAFGFTVGEKCQLHLAFVRDGRLTLAETLARAQV